MRTVPPGSQPMQRARRWVPGALLSVSIVLLIGWASYVSRGAGPEAADFAPDDPVNEIAFTIAVGEEGDALSIRLQR